MSGKEATGEGMAHQTSKIGDMMGKNESQSGKFESTNIDSNSKTEGGTLSNQNYSEDHEGKENQKPDDEEGQEKRGKPSACVFVASLCASKTDDELWESVTNHFSVYGKISAVKVLRDTANRPYAFVQYNNDTDSNKAIKLGNNSILDGRSLRCEAAKVNRTLFVNFFQILSVEEVKSTLSEFGEIEDYSSANNFGTINYDRFNRSRFWFVKFVYRDDAIRAFANLTNDANYEVKWAQNIDNGNSFRSTYTPVKRNQERRASFDRFSIFIGQLSQETTEDDLQERFSKHGKIESINLVHKDNNVFAFIKFEEETGAARSVESENHSMFMKKTIHVQYKEYHGMKPRPLKELKGIQLAPSPINSVKKFNKKKQYDYYLIPGGNMGNQRQVSRFSQYDYSQTGSGSRSRSGSKYDFRKAYPFGAPSGDMMSYSPKSSNGNVYWEYQHQ